MAESHEVCGQQTWAILKPSFLSHVQSLGKVVGQTSSTSLDKTASCLRVCDGKQKSGQTTTCLRNATHEQWVPLASEIHLST
jgi:hypothetical protein